MIEEKPSLLTLKLPKDLRIQFVNKARENRTTASKLLRAYMVNYLQQEVK